MRSPGSGRPDDALATDGRFGRDRATEALQESEARFRSVAESAPDAIVVADEFGTIISVNLGAERMFGYRQDEIVGSLLTRLMPEQYRERHQAALGRVRETGDATLIGRTVELEGLRKSGEVFPIELSLGSWRTARGMFFSGIVRDTTERKATAEALRREAGYVRLLQDVAVAANEAATVDDAVQVVLDRICRSTGWPVGHAYVAAEDGTGDFVPTTIWHLDTPDRFAEFRGVTETMRMARGVGLPGRVAASGAPVWVVDVLTDDNFPRAKQCENVGVGAGFAFPVLIGSEVVAVLEFFSAGPVEPDEQLLEVAAHVGAQLGRVVERARAKRALETREAQLQEAQAIAAVGSWEWDVATNEVTWSDELYRIFGLDRSSFEATFEAFLTRVYPDDRDPSRRIVEQALGDGRPFTYDHRIVRPDGTVRTLHARGEVIVDGQGRVARMVGTGQDVTEQRQGEAALRSAFEREREAVERLRGLDEMKNAILTAVSHELRTPLTLILGFAQTLQRDGVATSTPDRDVFLRKIAENALKLDRLLSDLLDLDRLDRGILEPRRRPTDLAALVQRVVRQSGVAERLSIGVDAASATINVDAPRVERIVENLLVNAARYTPTGSRAWVRIRTVEGGAEIAVDDDGPGVPAVERDSIFEPFRQGTSAPAHSPGVGIGLSLVARFAAMHGGRAWVEDRPGGGASFRVFLPNGPILEGDVRSGDPAGPVPYVKAG